MCIGLTADSCTRKEYSMAKTTRDINVKLRLDCDNTTDSFVVQFPVIEPILMTLEEFKNLPEFKGF